MNRRDFVKGLVAVTTVAAIPHFINAKEVSANDKLKYVLKHGGVLENLRLFIDEPLYFNTTKPITVKNCFIKAIRPMSAMVILKEDCNVSFLDNYLIYDFNNNASVFLFLSLQPNTIRNNFFMEGT